MRRVPRLTPERMTWALRSAGVLQKAAVVSLSYAPIREGGGYVGETFRCAPTYDSFETGAPTSVVVKTASADPAVRHLLDEFGLNEREIGFYTDLRDETEGVMPLPRCYLAERDAASGECLLLLEDLSPALPGDRALGLTVEQARKALDVISRMHARWWQNGRLSALGWLPQPNSARTKRLVLAEYDSAWATAESQYGDELPLSLHQLGRALATKLSSVMDRLSMPPVTLVHGDYQLGNIFFSSAGDIAGVIDWQVALRGRGPMDVSHLLVRSLSPEDRRFAEHDLVTHYHGQLMRSGVNDYTLEECVTDYQLALICEFGLGLILSALLTTPMQLRNVEVAAEHDLQSKKGMERFLAALVDLRWEQLSLFSSRGRRFSLRRALKAVLPRSGASLT